MEVSAEFLYVNSDDLVPFAIVLGWVNVVDVGFEPVPGCLVDQLFFVRGRNDNYLVLGPELAQLGLHLGKDLIARRVSSPEDRVRLVQQQYAGALLSN